MRVLEVCERENLKQALRRVLANKGSPGIDGMTVERLSDFLRKHWPAIRTQLLNGTYQPRPVKRVEIPKATDGVKHVFGLEVGFCPRYTPPCNRSCLQPPLRTLAH